MPNIITALKAEISRIARKEAKQAVAPLHKPTAGARRTFADLKRRVAALEKDNKRMGALLAKIPQPEPQEEPAKTKGGVSGKGVRSLRQNLGLSQQAFAKLLGIGNNTVYKWESKPGMLQLRDNTRAALMAAQQMGAREAKAKAPQPQPAPQAAKTAEAPANAKGGIRGKDVRSLRQSLGLSHQVFAKLVGVGHNTTYRWESKPGMLQLRDNTRAVLLAARKLSAREAQAKLAAMPAARKARPAGKAKK